MDSIKVAYVGCGGMAGHYLNVYRSLDFVRVVACIDINAETARSAAEALSCPLATTSFDAALGDGVDAVIINTPNSFHRDQAVAAMDAGKHVLLQKPVAADLASAEAIDEAAVRARGITGLYMSYFDQPLVHDLRDMVVEGRLGSIAHLYARLMHKGGIASSKEALKGNRTWRTSIAETGGGCFIQLAVHYVHIFEWATGAKVARVSAVTRNLHCPGIEGEDLACAILELDSGSVATIDTAWCTNGEQLAFHGTLGRLEYRNNRWLSMASSVGPYRGRVVDYPGGHTAGFDGVHGMEHNAEILPPAYGDASNPLNQHRQFLEAVRDNRPAFCSIASGVDDMRIVQAVYESARTGRSVEVQHSPAEVA